MGLLKKERESAEKLGFQTFLHGKRFLPFINYGSLEIPNQAKFHPIKFLVALRKAAEKYGVKMFENTEALEIKGQKEVIIKTSAGEISGDYSVTATYEPWDKPKELFAHKSEYISYVMEGALPNDIISPGLYEDEKNPYHYFRIDKGNDSDRIILGGEDHRKEIPIGEEKNFRALKKYLINLLPKIKVKIIRKWSGPIIETIDGLPYIGKYSKVYPNRLVATGFSGNGMTYSAVSAQIIADTILKKKNPYVKIYDAGRKTKIYNFMKEATDFTGEFFGGAVKNILK